MCVVTPTDINAILRWNFPIAVDEIGYLLICITPTSRDNYNFVCGSVWVWNLFSDIIPFKARPKSCEAPIKNVSNCPSVRTELENRFKSGNDTKICRNISVLVKKNLTKLKLHMKLQLYFCLYLQHKSLNIYHNDRVSNKSKQNKCSVCNQFFCGNVVVVSDVIKQRRRFAYIY
jgi:hypothetical protein